MEGDNRSRGFSRVKLDRKSAPKRYRSVSASESLPSHEEEKSISHETKRLDQHKLWELFKNGFTSLQSVRNYFNAHFTKITSNPSEINYSTPSFTPMLRRKRQSDGTTLWREQPAECRRLEVDKKDPDRRWREWGPYLSERQWGTVREDYSDNGSW